MRTKMLEDTRARIATIEKKIAVDGVDSWNREDLALKALKQKEMVLTKSADVIDAGTEELKAVWSKLNQIEAKEKCLRVQFLDWLSDKLLDWSNRVHVMACKIDSPCIIEVAPRKKEESKHAKETKEIARLKELLAVEEEANAALQKHHAELTENLLKEFADLQKEITK